MPKFKPVETVRVDGTLYSTDGKTTVFIDETPVPIFIDSICVDETYTLVQIKGISVEGGKPYTMILNTATNLTTFDDE
ncbi:hypothetical protein [Secundilactobacillus yichangensis]|uniref:hypothetical protein n=1 Tax=Secundilactobacillus yichangensis TaxID=2799580 RepID=UPI0019436C50|nr:hypothetical protein [Secundilactobacillus yichangensis]